VLPDYQFHQKQVLERRYPQHAMPPPRNYQWLDYWKLLVNSAASTVFFLSSPAAFSGESIWLHNGSKIRWVSDGDSRRAYYAQPRSGLDKIGIFPGQLLFDGYRRGSIVAGQAYTFKRGCPALHFSVSANLLSETTIDLRGSSPRREAGCVVTSFVETDLKFDYVETLGGAPSVNSPTPEPSSSPTSKPPTTTSDAPEACKKFPLLCN
jgi:hypothetical protein